MLLGQLEVVEEVVLAQLLLRLPMLFGMKLQAGILLRELTEKLLVMA